jgi:hypothetical protein|tara:strand:- start:9845 stop:10078 length:234 start_codon:yes stop_codon:yes gene_type:complete
MPELKLDPDQIDHINRKVRSISRDVTKKRVHPLAAGIRIYNLITHEYHEYETRQTKKDATRELEEQKETRPVTDLFA